MTGLSYQLTPQPETPPETFFQPFFLLFCPLFWYGIHLSSLVRQILPLSLEVCPLSLDRKVPIALHHCFRAPLCQLRVPVLVLPDSHRTCFPELLTQKGLHIAGLGRLLFSSDRIQNTGSPMLQVYFVPSLGWNNPPAQLIKTHCFPILANTIHLPLSFPLILTLVLFIPGMVCWVVVLVCFFFQMHALMFALLIFVFYSSWFCLKTEVLVLSQDFSLHF